MADKGCDVADMLVTGKALVELQVTEHFQMAWPVSPVFSACAVEALDQRSGTIAMDDGCVYHRLPA
jgi:hypothetical protein